MKKKMSAIQIGEASTFTSHAAFMMYMQHIGADFRYLVNDERENEPGELDLVVSPASKVSGCRCVGWIKCPEPIPPVESLVVPAVKHQTTICVLGLGFIPWPFSA